MKDQVNKKGDEGVVDGGWWEYVIVREGRRRKQAWSNMMTGTSGNVMISPARTRLLREDLTPASKPGYRGRVLPMLGNFFISEDADELSTAAAVAVADDDTINLKSDLM